MLNKGSNKVDFYKTKYGENLLIDLIRLESLEKHIKKDESHYLSYFDITIITNGNGRFRIDENQYKIKKGLVVFTSPGQIRKWDFDKVPKGYVLIFEEEFITTFFNDQKFIAGLKYFNRHLDSPALNLGKADMLHIVKIFEDIEQEIRNFKTNDKHILRALLYQVLIWLKRKFDDIKLPHNSPENNRHISLFIDSVSKNFTKQHTVLFYAEKLCISAGHLNDLSKSVIGISAKKYILNRVFIEAKKLLAFTDLPISEIALNLGFVDTSYFIRKFKSETNRTPLAFRKENNP